MYAFTAAPITVMRVTAIVPMTVILVMVICGLPFSGMALLGPLDRVIEASTDCLCAIDL
jgi:hypothetical protein